MSRLPRFQEHLKTGFAAEAASAARFRAYAARAEQDQMPNLARRWLELAAAKDALAILQLEAAGQVHGEDVDVQEALSEERYENEVLYPKMIDDVGGETAQIFERVVVGQDQHLRELEELRRELQAARGDIG